MNAQIKIQQPMQKASEMTIENLDHWGWVAGLVDEIGIVEKVNQLVGEQPGEIVSPGLVVKAMIIMDWASFLPHYTYSINFLKRKQ